MLCFADHMQKCNAVEGSLNVVEMSVGIALELMNTEQVTVNRGDRDNPILQELVIDRPVKV